MAIPTGPFKTPKAEQLAYQAAAVPLPKKPKPKKPTFITGKNGSRIQVNPNGTRYVIKRAGGGIEGLSSGGIETPAQIEARVTRMADSAFNRERNALREEADRLRKDAEGRRMGMQAAYQAAGQANAGMGADIQKGWEQAGSTVQGLAQAGSGSIADALRADVATQDQALARVGQAGTGFDASSQAGVEAYRGGFLPAEADVRLGGIGRQWMGDAGAALNTRGLQEGLSAFNTANRGIGTDLLSQVKDLTLNRTKYEQDLRSEFMGARSDQIKVAQQAASDLVDARQQQQELDQNYRIALDKVQTAQQKAQVDAIYKQSSLAIKQQEVAALNAQRYASANLSGVKAADIIKHPGTGGGKTAKVKTVAEVAKEAGTRIGMSGLNLQPRKTKGGIQVPYRQVLLEYLLALYGDAVPAKDRPALKRKLVAISKSAPRPKGWGTAGGDVLGGLPG